MNASAEKYFGKKIHEFVNQDYMKMFVAEKDQISMGKELGFLLANKQDGKINIPVKTASGKIQLVDCHVITSGESLNEAAGMKLIIKK